MKKNIFTLLIALLFVGASQLEAQIKTPAPSPAATVMQTVGMTDFTVEYSRPGKRGRQIFGKLVPYDMVWRTGANQATKISFDNDITVEGTALKAGDYALFTKPGMSSWEVHFYEHTTTSSGGYKDATPAALVKITPKKMATVRESFTIEFTNLSDDSGHLVIAWDNVEVPIKVGVNSQEVAMKSIEKTLAGPSTGDYYNAGTYMARVGADNETALKYIRMATESDDPKFWQVKQEAEILAKMGRHKEAITKATTSLDLATKAGNENYVRINKENIAKWSKM